MPALVERIVAQWQWLVMGFLGLVGFTWLSDGVGDHDGATYVDAPVAQWFANSRNSLEASIGLLVAKATSPPVLILTTAVVFVVLWRRGRKHESIILGLAVCAAYVAGGTAKYLEQRARPSAPINLGGELSGSFPSGHVLVVSTITFVCLGLAWSHLSRRARLVATLAALLVVSVVALDRLIVGAHWLTDVLGSLFLASMIVAGALLAHSVWRHTRGKADDLVSPAADA